MSFITARLHGTKVPPVRELPVASGAAFETGALLIKNNDGAYAECGADPTAVAAVAESGFGADTSGFNHLARKEFPPGMMQATKVMGEQPFHAEYVGTLPAAAGGSYGVVRDTDGRWKVDFADTTNLVVRLISLDWTKSPLNRKRVEVIFLPAVVQII
jgi:hypothetical protein